MAGDYQLALLLQRQLEHENSNGSDLYLARKLQEDFNKEVEIDNPVRLIYDEKEKSEQDTRSLVDPSWELVDPTPNIYNLFVVFNQRFFLNKLVAVCVSWSKKMTSCAGICSYQGKGGMCSITLSEPLLKLRPRKDLVETLLHEMIHAYLFVTDNNKDRDGHGPEFHKHMYRINKEAGTNITVYHSFHDEVRLYQQHWWRCNGPCQNKKPYFGMVRRAINRAPGPYDRWWDEHARTCGGTFVKVREPEKKTKTQKENKPLLKISSAGDIRKMLPVINGSNYTKSPLSSDINSQKGISNLHGLNVLDNNTQNNSKVFQVSGNIHGLSNLSKCQNSPTSTAPQRNTNNRVIKSGGYTTKTKSNSNSTIVINKKPSTLDINKSKETTKTLIDVFVGTGKCLTSPEKINNKHSNDDYSMVRNHWLNKFPVVSSSGSKRSINNTAHPDNESSKKQKTESGFAPKSTASNSIALGTTTVICPICENQIKESLINSHLDSCLQDQKTDTKKLCFICNTEVAQVDYQDHFGNCFRNNINDNEEQIECEICNMHFKKERIEEHRQACVEEVFFNSTPSNSSQHFPDTNDIQNSTALAQCPMCDDIIDAQEINNHKAKCLLKLYDDVDKKHNLKLLNEEIKCLVCSKKVLKSELNAHMDDCMGDVFDVKNDFNTLSNDKSNINGSCSNNCDNKKFTKSKYNCPFCMKLYSELDMSGHLDQCLIDDVDSNSNKSILVDSFSDNDIL